MKNNYKNLEYYLYEGTKKLGIQLSENQINMFINYYIYLIEQNNRMNLTNITSEKEVAIKHFIDSLSCVLIEESFFNKKVVDVGTGAGFPGIPVKILYPEIKLYLIDSQKKRVQFLYRLVELLTLKDVNIGHDRVEILGRNINYRDSFDICLARAVSSLNVLSELCLPFLKIGGLFITQKGPDVKSEVDNLINALELLGGRIKYIKKIKLPFIEDGRSLVVIEKIKDTPEKYPRRVGIPGKRPL